MMEFSCWKHIFVICYFDFNDSEVGVDSYNDFYDIYGNDDVWDVCTSGNGGNTCVSHMTMTRIEQLAKKIFWKKLHPLNSFWKEKFRFGKSQYTICNIIVDLLNSSPLTFFQKKNFWTTLKKDHVKSDQFVHIEIGKHEQRLIKQKSKDLCL